MASKTTANRKQPAATTKSPRSGLDNHQKQMADKIMSDFLEHAGWGTDDETKQQDLEAIDERIEKHRQEIALLEQVKADFDNREIKAREFVDQMVVLMGATANEKTIMDALCVRTNTSAPKKKRATKPRVEADPKVMLQVADVLDGEGLTFGEIKKQLNDLDPKGIRKALDKLLDDDTIGKTGEKRSTRYMLLDVGTPEPPEQEDEPEEDDVDDGEYDE